MLLPPISMLPPPFHRLIMLHWDSPPPYSQGQLPSRLWLTLTAKVSLLGSVHLMVSASQLRISSMLPCRCTLSIMKGINILGTAILRLSGHSPSGQLLETHQPTYMTDCSSKIFLSRETCSELSMIPRHFPTISEVMLSNDATSGAVHIQQPNATALLSTPPLNDTGLTAPCHCPKCQPPPSKPDTILFPPTEENREKLQAWFIDYYHSSTFNMCEHQPLPMMESLFM